MSAVLAGIIVGATFLVAFFTLEGPNVVTMLACLAIAFAAGIVAAAYSEEKK